MSDTPATLPWSKSQVRTTHVGAVGSRGAWTPMVGYAVDRGRTVYRFDVLLDRTGQYLDIGVVHRTTYYANDGYLHEDRRAVIQDPRIRARLLDISRENWSREDVRTALAAAKGAG